MNGSVIRGPSRPLKEQFSTSSEHGKSSPTRSFGSGQMGTGGASRSLVSAPADIGRNKIPVCPIVVLTGGDVLSDNSVLNASAEEYIVKSWITPEALTHALENASNASSA